MSDFEGIFPAILIPMDSDYKIDVDALVDHMKDLFKDGCKGVALFGTTGEAASFSLEDRVKVVEAVIERGIEPKKIILGCGFCSIEDTVHMIRISIKYNLLAVLWQPPFFFKNLSEDGVVEFYKVALNRVNDPNLKVILYNFPANTCVPLTHNIIQRLCDLFPSNIIGIKDSSFSFDHTVSLIKKFPNLKIYVGKDTDTSELVREGAVGAIVALSNVCPKLMCSLYEFGKDNTKPNRNEEINKLWTLIHKHYLMCSVKALLAAKKGPKWGIAKPPLQAITQEQADLLAREFKELGINY